MNQTVGHTHRAVDTGLLILRVGIGLLFLGHGLPKMTGGVENWQQIGGAMSLIGINFAPAFWGFLAATAEAVGGILLVLGLFTRPAAFFLLLTMLMATMYHVNQGSRYALTAHPGKMAVVFLAILFTGAGCYALSRHIKPLSNKWWG